jgi:aspartokinase/homoserine dehydrogenase 1
MERQLDRLRDEYGVDLRVRAIANSSSMIVDENQIDLGSWRERMSAGKDDIPADLDRLVDFVHTEAVPHAAIIDCTASESVASRYGEWLAAGVHVITPNKKANSGAISYYRELVEHGRRADAHYFYETTVGAALPIIQTLRDLVQTGDVIQRIDGIFSGTLAYLFNRFDGSEPFSSIVSAARKEGYTEPDPRDDLSGMDVARKVVILAREMGLDVGLSDVKVEGLVPPGLEAGSPEDFLRNLEDHDDAMFRVFKEARARNEVLRFVGTIDPGIGCSVSLQSLDNAHSFARGSHTDNTTNSSISPTPKPRSRSGTSPTPTTSATRATRPCPARSSRTRRWRPSASPSRRPLRQAARSGSVDVTTAGPPTGGPWSTRPASPRCSSTTTPG